MSDPRDTTPAADGDLAANAEPTSPPRPAYGEYASPEELREILGPDHPLLKDATDALAAPAPAAHPVSPAEHATAATPPAWGPPGASQGPSGPHAPPYAAPTQHVPPHAPHLAAKPVAKPRPRWDLPITVGLLVFGAFNVITTLTSRDLYPQRFEQVFRIMDLGDFTATGPAAAAANWDAGLQLAILVVTIAVVALVVRRLRFVFWIPLVGGALASVASMIVSIWVMVQDPAYLQMLQG
ncbi:hypothetical protein GCM10027515_27660 [Schumannella luteola]|uniref:Uncharacterized protein n=1 Tax=Schumannella luteola TaxID=472059 RepID=A0A852Y8Z7_9MICO|nr:DUF6264 family protein [Schumannella luteola]NYG99436.1 hypothetical protein [Schumannella luteola]TPX06152.1 hypothetical protein FJ656_03230 [Schumannella luteola]